MSNDKQNALNMLRKFCPKGTTVYCVLRGVSRSGMSRNIDFFVIKNNRPNCITGYMADADIVKQSQSDGSAKVGGCGMDMGFHVVYKLSMALYCPDKYEHDAAYSLKSSWM